MSEYGPDFFRYYIDRLDERQMTSEVVAPGAAGRAAGRADAERRYKSIEKKLKNDFLDKFYGTDREPETLCPPGARSPRCGGGNIDYENFRPPEGIDPCPSRSQKWDPKTGRCVDDRPQIDYKNFRPPEGFDPCPGKSQTLDPKTGKCVSVTSGWSMRDIIDRMQNDPMARPKAKGRK